MHKILVPVDGSTHALKALRIACDLAEKYDGSIVLLHVISPAKSIADLLNLAIAKTFGPKVTGGFQRAADKGDGVASKELLFAFGEKVLEQAAAKVKRVGLECETLGMEENDPAQSILIARKRVKANTIVMGSRGVSANSTASFGSVSQVVFEKAPCTCLSVK